MLCFYIVLYILCPVIYCFQVSVVLPEICQIMQAGFIQVCIHVFLATLCLINICGNMMMCCATDLNGKEVFGDINYCEHCKMYRSVNSWHCKSCNHCVFKRDHHCPFVNCCVGLLNKRYYILFLGYIMFAMTYATLYNYIWISSKFYSKYEMLFVLWCLLNRDVRHAFALSEVGVRELCVLHSCLILGFAVWSGGLFYCHFKNAVMGVTVYENKHHPELRNPKRWKQNLLDVFGVRWYWALVWPFCRSPLPIYVNKINNNLLSIMTYIL